MHENSIKLLNQAVSEEIAALHQYMYFHFHCDDQGYDLLAGLFKRTAIEEMLHVERLAERILFLGGEVEMKVGREVEKIHDAHEMVARAKQLEQEAIDMYNRFAAEAGNIPDSGSKKLFEALVDEEELHWDQFDQQAEHIERFGEQYLALQSFQGEGGPGGQPPA